MTGNEKNQQTNVEQGRLVTTNDLAQRLKVSRRHIFRLLAAGKLPRPVRVGAAIRWRQSDIDLWLEWGCCPREKFDTLKEAARGRRTV